MDQWITDLMDSYGYAGILALIFLENFLLFIPSVFVLTMAGLMTTTTDLTIPGVVAIATLGSLLGAMAQYGIGRMVPAERLEAFVTRYGKAMRLKPGHVRKANAWFERYGIWVVLASRLIPLVRTLVSLPAGSASVKLLPFALLTIAGATIWNTVLVTLGASLVNLDDFAIPHACASAVWLAFVSAAAVLIIRYGRIRRRASKS